MKRNLYYRQLFKRVNVFQELFLALFLAIASWPRLVIEVFIRKHFGERYFSLSSVITVFVLLAALPFARFGRFIGYGTPSFMEMVGRNFSWYAFLIAFLVMGVIRWQEIKRLPSVFDFERFSLSTGDIHPRFYTLSLGGKHADKRMIEILLEPALFLVIGFILWLMSQQVGMLLIVCSIIYSLSYRAAYHLGDNFIMDQIDELLYNQELFSSFVDGIDPSKTHGVDYYGRKPTDPDTRRKLAENFIERNEPVEVR